MSKAKYYIYRNLNRGMTFSVRFRGRVIAVLDGIRANNVMFKVSPAGRQRVLRDKKRNVHAFAVCDSWEKLNPAKVDISGMTPVWYNPFKAEQFQAGNIDIFDAPAATFFCGKCYV